MVGLGRAPLVTCYQIHSADVVRVTTPWAQSDAPKADALVTNQPGLALGVLTADCAPRSEEHTSELQSHHDLVCRLLLEKKNKKKKKKKKKKNKYHDCAPIHAKTVLIHQ